MAVTAVTTGDARHKIVDGLNDTFESVGLHVIDETAENVADTARQEGEYIPDSPVDARVFANRERMMYGPPTREEARRRALVSVQVSDVFARRRQRLRHRYDAITHGKSNHAAINEARHAL